MTRANDDRFSKWKEDANAVDLLTAAAGHGATLKRQGAEWIGPCPACGGRDRLSIHPAKSVWNCRGAKGGNDAIGLVMHVANLSFTQACESLTGEPPPNGQARPLSAAERAERDRRRQEAEAAQRQREADERAYQENTLATAQRIWSEAKPIAGTLAETYLHNFGLPTPPGGWPECLGFHPALPYPDRGRMPALVARVDNLHGDLVGIWREFMSPDGCKADVELQKLGLGPVSGGAVRLGGEAARIGVAEGVRTALGAWALIGFAYPVWSVLSTAGMTNFDVPLFVDRIDVYPDGDRPMRRKDGEYIPAVPAGRKAALTIKEKMAAAGVDCLIAAEPPAGSDYLDLWQICMGEAA